MDDDTFTVTGQRETTAVGPDGRFSPSVIVSFKTSKGYSASVTVPESAFNADYVKARIDEKIAAFHAVHDLS